MQAFYAEISNKEPETILLHSDNTGAMAMVKDLKFHLHTKHIDV
jgi:lactam utilization protein B